MLKLNLSKQNSHSLIRSHNSFKDLGWVDMSMVLRDSIRQGTKVHLVSDNTKPEPHRGDYYLLFMQEYQSVYLFYLDIKGILRIVYSGNAESAAKAIYNYVANDTDITILKSDSKRAYRVAKIEWDGKDVVPSIIPAKYKNKSCQELPQVYLNLFEAINLAVTLHSKDKKHSYYVITPKESVMFAVNAD